MQGDGLGNEMFSNSVFLDLSIKLGSVLPRGKGAIPRLAGQLILRDRLYRAPTPQGFDMHWTASSLDMLTHLSSTGEWDAHVLHSLRTLIEPGCTFYDIGSNIGYMALSIAHDFPDVQVFAFEPLPDMASAIRSSARANGMEKLSVINAAVSTETGETSFFLPRHSIHASLVSRETSATELRVKTLRLDDAGLPPPDVIKIDVEGAEMFVIAGGSEVLAKHMPHLVYECDGNTERFSHTPRDMITALQRLGYDRFFRILGDTRTEIKSGDEVSEGDFVALSSKRKSNW